MLEYLKNKIRKYKAKRTFQEYPYKLVEFDIAGYGKVRYAQWLNPLERPKILTVSKIEFFKRFLKAGDWAVDIGAHTGDTPIPMALAVGKSGKILALEPNPHIFKILTVNAGLNPEKTTIVPLDFAATESDGEFFYSSSEASFNNGGIAAEQDNRHGKFALQTKVKGANLERYLKKNYPHDIGKIRLVKIDTEGYDAEVIKSIDNFIKTYKPALIFEVFGKLAREERELLFDRVAEKGYDLFYFQDFHSETETRKLSKADMMNWKHFDVFAVPVG